MNSLHAIHDNRTPPQASDGNWGRAIESLVRNNVNLMWRESPDILDHGVLYRIGDSGAESDHYLSPENLDNYTNDIWNPPNIRHLSHEEVMARRLETIRDVRPF